MRKIVVAKGGLDAPPITIEISATPLPESVEEESGLQEQDAGLIAVALRSSLPSGTLEQLVVRMLKCPVTYAAVMELLEGSLTD